MHMSTHTCIHTHKHTRMHKCTHTRECTHTHAHMHINKTSNIIIKKKKKEFSLMSLPIHKMGPFPSFSFHLKQGLL